MRVQDLGQLDGPVLLFGGPYSNLQATRAVLAEARRLELPPAQVICTGDIVAYCGDPVETIAEIRGSGCAVVAGNCEKQLAQYQMDCGCGFDAGSTCDLLSAGWYAHADASVGEVDRAWMDTLPDIAVFTQNGTQCAVIHGGLSDISRFVWSTSEEAEFDEEIALVQKAVGPVDTVIAGHCGIPFQRRCREVDWINAGVIGMPPNDGAPQTRYGLMQNGTVRIVPLSYDHTAASASMVQKGLTQGYDQALVSGYWPSEDVLPPALRRAALASG